jgi:hypothetical protein
MKVAVFGSWSDKDADKDWNFSGSRDEFNKACRAIGGDLADTGHRLIVESQEQDVADPHVVEDYLEHAISGTPSNLKIELAWPRGLLRPFEHHAKAHPDLFIYHQLPAPEASQRWSNSHLISLKHADAILTIGGKQGVYLAGSTAIVAGKPLAPIASFGGASARLLADLKADRGGNLDPAYSALNGPWSQHVLKRALELLRGDTLKTIDTSKIVIFISHAHEDKDLALALVRVIREAFKIPSEAIRCTSLPGYKLLIGVHTASQLKTEIAQTEFVLGIITPQSIESKYVLLELGAAWGLGKRTFPLVARGLKASGIPGPLGELNWLDLAESPNCYQLIKELSSFKPMGDGNLPIVDAAVKDLVACAQQKRSSL